MKKYTLEERRRQQKFPDYLYLVRHGESVGNLARDEAEERGLLEIELPDFKRDVDVPLSELGKRQSAALGFWLKALSEQALPSVIMVSPYVRAQQTARLALESAGVAGGEIRMLIDERLREKEFGIFDRLTKRGIRERFPEHDVMRAALGKFYYRPPGGESWCDVILRLRSVIDTLTREYRGDSVMIVAHQVIVNCFRYLFERMTEAEILAQDRQADVPNGSITSYRFDVESGRKGKLVLDLLNFVAPRQA